MGGLGWDGEGGLKREGAYRVGGRVPKRRKHIFFSTGHWARAASVLTAVRDLESQEKGKTQLPCLEF